MTLDQKARTASRAVRDARARASFTVRSGRPDPRRGLRLLAVTAAVVLVGVSAITLSGGGTGGDVTATSAALTTLPAPDPAMRWPLDPATVVAETDGFRLAVVPSVTPGAIVMALEVDGQPQGQMKSIPENPADGSLFPEGLFPAFRLNPDGELFAFGAAPIETVEVRVVPDEGPVVVIDEVFPRDEHGRAFFVARYAPEDAFVQGQGQFSRMAAEIQAFAADGSLLASLRWDAGP